MSVQSPYAVPGINPAGVVQNVNLNQNPDTSPVVSAYGRSGELYCADVHGGRYAKASRGNLFWGTSGVAGAKLLAPGGTTGSFILLNPATSQKNLEVEYLRISGATSETVVISGLVLEGSVQTPTGTLTGATTSSMPLGTGGMIGSTQANSTANGKVYLAATIVAMTFIGGLGNTFTATTSPDGVNIIDFGGSLVLGPGMCINLCASISQTTDIVVADWVWSEFYP
jgi:hypothetical protein